MELAAAKMIGAGIACIALVGAGIGIGNVFASIRPFGSAALDRGNSAEPRSRMWIGGTG